MKYIIPHQLPVLDEVAKNRLDGSNFAMLAGTFSPCQSKMNDLSFSVRVVMLIAHIIVAKMG